MLQSTALTEVRTTMTTTRQASARSDRARHPTSDGTPENRGLPADVRRYVAFRDGDYPDASELERLEQARGVFLVAREPIERLGEHHIEGSRSRAALMSDWTAGRISEATDTAASV
jgi:hypothetical protein